MQIFVGRALQQVGARARRERAHDVGLVGVHAQDDHAGRPIELLGARGDLDAVQFRHADVEDDDVGPVLLAQAHRFEAVAGFGDHREAGCFEQAAQSAPDDAVIVSQQHAQAAPPSSGWQRQPHGQRRARARASRDRHRAVKFLDALVDPAQTEAAAGAARIETDAVVGHRHAQLTVRGA